MARRLGGAVLLVSVALTLGGIGATVGNFAGWRTSQPSPAVRETTALLRGGLPDAPVTSIGWHDDVHDVHQVKRPQAGNLPGQQQAIS